MKPLFTPLGWVVLVVAFVVLCLAGCASAPKCESPSRPVLASSDLRAARQVVCGYEAEIVSYKACVDQQIRVLFEDFPGRCAPLDMDCYEKRAEIRSREAKLAGAYNAAFDDMVQVVDELNSAIRAHRISVGAGPSGPSKCE